LCLNTTSGNVIIPIVTGGLLLFLLVSIGDDDYYIFSRGNNNHIAFAHFFGATKTIDNNYKIVFQPMPSILYVGDNSTLNFSILDKDNANVYNIFSTLIISDKNTGKIVTQIPYKFYEFSDITFPYRFQNKTNYIVSLQAKINGDPKYESQPIVANFDVNVGDAAPTTISSFKELMLYYITPASIAVLIGIIVYSEFKIKKEKEKAV
jgi:hypothetical protein